MGEIRKIAVMGATGRQGRGVIEALQFNKPSTSIQYEIRPMTRSLTSKLAQDFQRDFPELDLVRWCEDDIDSLIACFQGCYGVFINTGLSPTPKASIQELTRWEIALGIRCVEAAKTASIQHLIYPTFPSIFNASNGRINIRRFETKHQISLGIQSSSVPATILCPGPFYTDFYLPQYSYWEGDTVVFSTPAAPEKTMGYADPGHDIGWFARAALDVGPEYFKWKYVPVCGQAIAYADLAGKFSAATGIKASYRQCSSEDFNARFRNHMEPDQRDMKALGEWLAVAPDERTCYGTIGLEELKDVERGLEVKALSWEMFLVRTGWRGPPR